MTDPTTRLTDTADARPDNHNPAPSTMPASPATGRNADGRIPPRTSPYLANREVIPGDDDTPLHVVRFGKNWAIKLEGEDDRVAVTPTKAEACATARELAKDRGVRLIVHKMDGTIQRVLEYA